MLDTQDLDDPEISALKDQLLSLVSSRGLIESGELIRTLGWDAESYWYIGRLLMSAGVLPADAETRNKFQRFARAAGQGESAKQSVVKSGREKALYAPIVQTLGSAWVVEHGINDYAIELTASQGSRVTGGRWSRPDIALASSKEYKYVPGRLVELRTFEIKTHESLDVTAVYEALSHRRAAHFAQVLVHVPECERDKLRSTLERVIDHAEEYGVGVTTLADPQDFKTWRVEVDAHKSYPDPADVNVFINDQTGAGFKDKMLSWCRRT